MSGQKQKSFWNVFIYIWIIAILCGATACGGGTDDSSAPLRDSDPVVLEAEASGTIVLENKYAVIDVSNSSDGYVMIKYLGNKEGSKVQIVLLTQPYDGFKGEKEYTYDITAGDQYTIYPFSCGDGTYAIKVFEHLNGTSYAEVFTDEATVVLTNQNLPFLYPNQFVAFGSGDKVVSVGQEAVSTAKKDLDAVANIYHYVSENITYDDAKAELILTKKLESYLPVIDDTLASKTGICFDYAAVMTAMLRSQGIPAKLVIGYSGSVYHAWINVYIQDEGWIDKVIEFNGTDWVLMDPTFNSSLKNPKELNNYIGDGSIYQAMFYY